MREIKFRAWNPTDKVMGDPFSLIDAIWEYPDTWMEGCEKNLYLQYTGLKDKNGKEIYEGDILDTIPLEGWYYPNRLKVEYRGSAFLFVGITEGASPFAKHTLDLITNPDMKEIKALEVIGNIYENTELLNADSA